MEISCFKAYDIRGQIPNELNADICYRIGNATGAFLEAKTMVVGRDMRLTSGEFADAVIKGLTDAGVEVLDIGLCGTEMVYFATAHLKTDGGIMVTASHNPPEYNGFKICSGIDSVYGEQIQEILQYIQANDFETGQGSVEFFDVAWPTRSTCCKYKK